MGKEFPNVPKNMIATVIENNLEETGMGWIFDNELKPDLSRVRDQLNQVNTPEQLNMLQQERAEIDRRTNENREVRETYERVVQKFELANTRGDSEQVAAARRDIAALAETLKSEMEAQGASAAEAEAAAAQMLAEAEAEANPTNGNRLNNIPGLDQPINVGALLDQAVNAGRANVTPRPNGFTLDDMSPAQRAWFETLSPEDRAAVLTTGAPASR